MPGSKYGPTPPYRQAGSDGSGQLTPGVKGSQYGPELLSSDVGEWQTFNDGLSHIIARLTIDADLCCSVRATCEALDETGAPAGPQSAFFVVDNNIVRPAAVGAVPAIQGAPAFLSFTPNVAPWNTITAAFVLVVGSVSDVAIVVQDLRVVTAPIRWRGLIRIYGAQGKSAP